MRISKLFQIGTSVLLAALTVSLFQNCGGTGDANVAAAGGTISGDKSLELKSLSDLIKDLNDDDLSCVNDNDCDVLPLGVRACGGPAEYIVISLHNPQLSRIQQYAEELEAKAIEYVQQSNMASTCIMVLPPNVSCRQNRCQ